MSLEKNKNEFMPISISKVKTKLINALDVIAVSKKMSRTQLMILALEEYASNNFKKANQKSMFD